MSMSEFFRALSVLAFGLLTLVSCQSTIPDAADLDRYEKQATDLAERQIALLDAQLARGEISQVQRDRGADAIRADIPKRAHDLAWTMHELAESEKRAWGMPTGDAPLPLRPPQPSAVANSFYQPKGEVGSGFGSFQNPNSVQHERGYTPSSSNVLRDVAVPTEQRRVYEPEPE